MQNQNLFKFPKARVPRSWFRQFNDKKHFHNDGTLQLFSLMALYSYANYRSDKKTIAGKSYLVSPGQWICKASALPRIMRVHSKDAARILLRYFRDHGFLDFEVIDEEQEIIRYDMNNLPLLYLDLSEYLVRAVRFYLHMREQRCSIDRDKFDAIMHLNLNQAVM